METDFSYSESTPVFHAEEEQAVVEPSPKSAPRRNARKKLMEESSSDEEPVTSPPQKSSITSNNVAQKVLEMIMGLFFSPDNATIGEKKVATLTKLRGNVILGQKNVPATPVNLPQDHPPPISVGRATRAVTRASAKKQTGKLGKKGKKAAKEPSVIDLDEEVESEVVVSREEIIESRVAQSDRNEKKTGEKKRVELEIENDQIQQEEQGDKGIEGELAKDGMYAIEEVLE